jgi:hypothetical protein
MYWRPSRGGPGVREQQGGKEFHMVDGDVPERMQAAAFDEFGGPEVITPRILHPPRGHPRHASG